jgi:hypothetical protein
MGRWVPRHLIPLKCNTLRRSHRRAIDFHCSCSAKQDLPLWLVADRSGHETRRLARDPDRGQRDNTHGVGSRKLGRESLRA